MMLRMAGDNMRLTESAAGRVAGWLLAALWVFSMSGVDSSAFSSFPVCVVLALVLLLVVVGVLAGRKIVRLSALGWFSLLAGVYFLVRSLNSYALVDSWVDTTLILGAFVYYLAGVYAAQNRTHEGLFRVLGGALVLNLLAFVVVRQPWFCLEWTGRASHTPAGENSLPVSLFVYKNFAGVFFCLGGCILGGWAMWLKQGAARWGGLFLAVLCVGASFYCITRAVFVVLPLSLFALWGGYLCLRAFSDKKIGGVHLIVGLLLLAGGGIVVFDFFFGSSLHHVISGVDSHLRYLIWGAIGEVLPAVPLWGCGANATVWEIVPFYNEWQLPNYAHNEYLQTWVDYGIIGLVLMLLILVFHVVHALRCVAAVEETMSRRVLAVLSLVVLVAVSAYAVVDFPWHSFAFVSLTAFVCGVMASPFKCRTGSFFTARTWASGSRIPMVGVRAQGWPGRVFLLLLMSGLLVESVWMGKNLYPAWLAQWEYNELSRPGVDVSGDKRRELISHLAVQYPGPALADTYFMLPPCKPDLAAREKLLKRVLAANPKQLFTAVMLVDVLGAEKKFMEAEQLMRTVYVGDSMPGSMLSNWPAYYAYNLLIWGKYELQQGNHAVAYSLLDYALKLHEQKRIGFNPVWRSGPQPWKAHGGIKPGLPRLIESVCRDVRMLRLIQLQPDDSWMHPLVPGGRAALYQHLVKKTSR